MAGLGLRLYNLGARPRAEAPARWADRPPGRLVWLHLPDGVPGGGMAALAARFAEEDGHPVLLTAPGAPGDLPPGVLHCAAPDDSPAAMRAFLDHWRPEAILFSGDEVRPATVQAASARGIPMALVEGLAPRLPAGRRSLFPGVMRQALGAMSDILLADDRAAAAYRKLGLPHAVTGRMEEPSAVLPCNEPEREALARLVATRPVWLAAGVPETEEAAVIAAHRAALPLAHRLLLILVPQDAARATPLADRIETDEGWIAARRAAEEEPDPDVGVFIADMAEMGLWYRLAPVCYLGGALSPEGPACSPLHPAALGASVILGPQAGAQAATFARLITAGAARPIASAAELPAALTELLAPDTAARLARAAWAVTTEGVEVTDRAVALLRRMLGEA